MKKLLSVLLCLIMLMGAVVPAALSSAQTDFDLYYTYSDIQINKTSADQRYGSNNNHISGQLLPSVNGGRGVYLAKNELEGFQVDFFERGTGRKIDIEFTPFVNSDGEVLECKVYNEIFLIPKGVTEYKLADALIPYNHEGVQTATNENNTFFLELHSKKDQTPGNYVSTVTLKDENGILNEQKVTAVVWNFALPEGHLSTYLVGNYNSASGYYTTSGFLRLAGIKFDKNGNVASSDKKRAEEILEAYDEFFLENGITPYEIPAYLIEKDSKQAELAMADPRRSLFMVPITSYATSNGAFSNSNAVNTINAYKSLVNGNKFLENKAFFYPADEPSWKNEADASAYLEKINAIKNIWGEDYHAMVPFFSLNSDSYVYNLLKTTTDILCPNQGVVSSTNSSNDTDSKREIRADLGSDSWLKTLRYQGDTWQGNTYLYNYNRSTKGVFTRVLQWQASALNSDGMLHWNGLFVPDNADGTPYDVFANNELFGNAYPSTGGGDGIYVYSGVSLGVDATTPIASLRLKQIQSGMDDFDYLSLVKEFLGEDAYTDYVNRFLRNYKTGGISQIWYCERNEGSGWQGDWVTWEVTTLNSARIAMGNALSQANTEHDYGDWEIAVGCDQTHNGLEIRTCNNCSAQESRAILCCDEFGHDFSIEKNDKDTHNKVCENCGYSVSVSHTGKTVAAVAPTCTKTGLTESTVCSECGEVLVEAGTVKALGHSWDNGKITKAPKCTEKGVMTFTCTRTGCTETKTEPIEQTNHPNKYDTTAVSPSCTESGYTAGTYCPDCGKYISGHQTVKATGHKDANGDHVCDICSSSLPSDPSSTCSHLCHKSGFLGFIWKIVNFFNKLFGINKTCACGAAHY